MAHLYSSLSSVLRLHKICRSLRTVTSTSRQSFPRHKARTMRERMMEKLKSSSTFVPVFEASKLVLDLEAENSPAVRPFSKKDQIEQQQRWAFVAEHEALMERISNHRNALLHIKEKWNRPLDCFDPARITSRDVLQVALLGSPYRQSTKQAEVDEQLGQLHVFDMKPLASALNAMGVTETITENNAQAIQILLGRLQRQGPQTTDLQYSSQLREFLQQARRTFGDPLERLKMIRRSLGPLLDTQEGCQLLSACRNEIVDTFPRLQVDEPYTWPVLAFLNNISANLTVRKLSFATELANALATLPTDATGT